LTSFNKSRPTTGNNTDVFLYKANIPDSELKQLTSYKTHRTSNVSYKLLATH